MPFKIFIGLVLCNVIWAANPMMGKYLMQDFHPLQVAWIRYTGALLCFFCLYFILNRFKYHAIDGVKPITTHEPKSYFWLFLIGCTTFFVSPFFQYEGLSLSSATENALIVAIEPIFTVMLARILLAEKIYWRQGLAFCVAIIGFFTLSNVNPFHLYRSFTLFNIGNLFILIAILAEAAYSSFSKKIITVLQPLQIFGYGLSIGWLLFTPVVWLKAGLPDIRNFTFFHLLGAFWMGPLGTTAAYIYWITALKEVSVAAVSLTLFIQPLQGAILGYLFMHERLTLLQTIGALFILSSLLLQIIPLRKAAKL